LTLGRYILDGIQKIKKTTEIDTDHQSV